MARGTASVTNHQASSEIPGEGSYYHQTTHVRWMLGKELTILEKNLRIRRSQNKPILGWKRWKKTWFWSGARCKLLRVKRSGLRRGIWGMSRRAGGGRTDNVFTASYARCIPLGLAGYTASYAWRSRTTASSRVNSSAMNNPSFRPGRQCRLLLWVAYHRVWNLVKCSGHHTAECSNLISWPDTTLAPLGSSFPPIWLETSIQQDFLGHFRSESPSTF